MFRTPLAAAFVLSAGAASAGGLAPPIQPLVSVAAPNAFLARCPVVQPVVQSLQAQGFTRVVAEPGERYARFSALRGDDWSVMAYDCRTGAALFSDTVAVAEADDRDPGVFLLTENDVDLALGSGGVSMDGAGSAGAGEDFSVAAAGTVAAGVDADATADAGTAATVSSGGNLLGNARDVDAGNLTQLDAAAAIQGGAVTDEAFEGGASGEGNVSSDF